MKEMVHKILETPTAENIALSIAEDRYGRMEQVCEFADKLVHIEGNYVLALDGKWGSGKTFFVKETQRLLDAASGGEDIEITGRCKGTFDSLKQKQPSVVTFYYDAWEHDTDDNSLLSILYALMDDERIGRCLIDDDKLVKSAGKIIDAILTLVSPDRAAALRALFHLGKGLADAADEARIALKKEHNRLDERLPELFRLLRDATKRERLIFFVDELDRCCPDFAVQLLETMKHYFTSRDVIFVLSVNRDQLCHTIKKHYGAGFDARLYLNKFFDGIETLEPVTPNVFRQAMQHDYSSGYNYVLVDGVMSYYRMELREMLLYRWALHVHPPVEGFYCDFTQEHMTAKVMPPILLGMAICDQKACRQFLHGDKEGCDRFLAIVQSIPNLSLDPLFGDILPENSTFYTERAGEKQEIDFETTFRQFYRKAFQYASLPVKERNQSNRNFVEAYRNDMRYLIQVVHTI